jgi:glutamate--cysteine ligase catalytic subunit
MLGAKEEYFKISEEELKILQTISESDNNFNDVNSGKKDLSKNPYSNSKYIDDTCTGSHPRFGALTTNVRKRKGRNVEIKIPIYSDINTNLTQPTEEEPFPGYIFLDSFCAGMGCTSFQITLGAFNLNSCCYAYDQLLNFTPLFLALSSSSPIYKGKLSQNDNRFDVISQAVDDRTDEEKNPQSSSYKYKSRYSPAYSYISEHLFVQDYLNNYPRFPINTNYLKKFHESGIPNRLSEHFCNLLTRDPLVIFDKNLDSTNIKDISHFENFNSTNWNSLRFKLPKIEDGDSLFKIEFRPCELQLTPFENSSIIAFLISIYSSIFKFDVNFILPITFVDENFKRASKMDAIVSQKFFWRINGIDRSFRRNFEVLKKNDFLGSNDVLPLLTLEEDIVNIKELSMKEILLGSEEYNYPGVLKMCYNQIEDDFIDSDDKKYLLRYFKLIERRVTGIILLNFR